MQATSPGRNMPSTRCRYHQGGFWCSPYIMTLLSVAYNLLYLETHSLKI
jgi:hypothetical protein